MPAEQAAERPDSWWSYPATYTLLAVNLIVFAAMLPGSPLSTAFFHHDWLRVFTAQFDGASLVRFGGCDSEYVLAGQWWRLLTACFVHGTTLHILLNLWCLWNLGLFGERLLGRYGLVAVYALTGIAGNLLSIALGVLAKTPTLIVGASGAVFGIAGILIVLLSNRGLARDGVPWSEIRSLRAQVGLFAVANLVLGWGSDLVPMLSPRTLRLLHINVEDAPRVGNSAHLGGFLCGLLLGWPLFSRMIVGKEPYRARQRVTFAAALLGLSMIGYALSKFA